MSEFIRFVPGIKRSEEFYEEQIALLKLPLEKQRERMEEVLKQTIEMAIEMPIYQPWADDLRGISSIEEFLELNLSFSSNIFLEETEKGKQWEDIIGIPEEQIFLLLRTSGSTGKPKLIPYKREVWDHCVSGPAPFVSYFLKNNLDTSKPMLGLALTSNKNYATYRSMPDMLVFCGIDVLHAPLGTVLRNEQATQELIEKIIQNKGVDVFSTVPPMAPVLVETLSKFPHGEEALELIQDRCKTGLYGGTVIHPRIEQFLKSYFGAVCNCYGSTESMAPAGSDDIELNNLHVATQYAIPFIRPVGEEKYILMSEAQPGTLGELIFTIPTVPWVALNTEDLVRVVSTENTQFKTPAFEFYARNHEVLKIGNALVYPEEMRNVMSLEGITDYLIQFLPAGEYEESQLRDKLQIFVEGEVNAETISDRLYSETVILGDNLRNRMLIVDIMTIQQQGYLNQLRRAKSIEFQGAVGPLKHTIVKGKQYIVPENVIVESHIID